LKASTATLAQTLRKRTSGEDFVKQRRSVDTIGSRLFGGEIESSSDREILSQEAFHKIISLERRRTERSRKPFLLMLLELGEHQAAAGKHLQKLLTALSASTRETDVAGWYEDNCVLGVMFTEIGMDDRETIVNTMISRLSEILRSRLSLEKLRISFHLFPEDWDHDVPKRPSNPALYPDLDAREENRRVSSGLKRTMDIIGSTLALLLGAPVFVAIALAIKATSRGPVFFRQQRIGQHGTPFEFLKFRSMHVGNDSNIHKQYVTSLIAGKAQPNVSNGNGGGVFKLTKDPRITRLGSFLRRTSLDELPQFINVLRGEMSLVGPRPPVPYEVEAYDLWHRRRLLEAKPGITGLWQVTGRSTVKFDDMVRLDLQYAKTWSPWMDIKILVRTPAVVIFGDGAH
jgi:lipopolysaccharide/colanic/teichoic acid biosynthesis glycosyltransferase